jgi:hypothetical protein
VLTDGCPDDADGGALRRLEADGSDLSRPMDIDFAVAVPGESSGKAVAEAARAAGYAAKVACDGSGEDEDSQRWTCYCTRRMVPSREALRAAEAELERVSAPHGGYLDGWGSFGNAEPTA